MTDSPALHFSRRAHLRAASQFNTVFAKGKRISGHCFRLHARPVLGATEAKLGVSVSKRVDKSAVARNRIRRQAKECFRQQRATLPAGEYVLLAKPPAAQTDNQALRLEILALLERARTLKPMPQTGTMPPSAATTGRAFPTDA